MTLFNRQETASVRARVSVCVSANAVGSWDMMDNQRNGVFMNNIIKCTQFSVW